MIAMDQRIILLRRFIVNMERSIVLIHHRYFGVETSTSGMEACLSEAADPARRPMIRFRDNRHLRPWRLL